MKTNKKNVYEMERFEVSRWLALMEAVDIVGDRCKDKKIPFEKFTIKQRPIEKYIEATCDSIYKCLEREEEEIKNNFVFKFQKQL